MGAIQKKLRQWLGIHPQEMDLDAPETTLRHRELIQQKYYLRRIYDEHYTFFKKHSASLPAGIQVELGSGGGYIQKILPQVMTSDILELPHVDKVFSALDMPFADQSLAAVYCIDVFHHLPDIQKFLEECSRCLVPHGKIIMVEPANTWWGRFIYQHFHHEPFIPEAPDWKLPTGGPMSMANGALPWIVLERDRAKFAQLFPHFKIHKIEYIHPIRYLISGGVSMRALLPDFTYPIIQWIEEYILVIFARYLGMFMRIEIENIPVSHT